MTLQSNFDLCVLAYNISGAEVQSSVGFTNEYFGGNHPASSRVLFVNGEVDGWKALGVLAPLGPELPAFVVSGSSHHAWTHVPQPSDLPPINAARQEIMSIVEAWLRM